jgi:hypothetical protein
MRPHAPMLALALGLLAAAALPQACAATCQTKLTWAAEAQAYAKPVRVKFTGYPMLPLRSENRGTVSGAVTVTMPAGGERLAGEPPPRAGAARARTRCAPTSIPVAACPGRRCSPPAHFVTPPPPGLRPHAQSTARVPAPWTPRTTPCRPPSPQLPSTPQSPVSPPAPAIGSRCLPFAPHPGARTHPRPHPQRRDGGRRRQQAGGVEGRRRRRLCAPSPALPAPCLYVPMRCRQGATLNRTRLARRLRPPRPLCRLPSLL